MTGVVFGAVIGLPVASIASVRTQNFLAADVEVSAPLVEAYDYQSGSTHGWEGSTEFETTGTLTNTATDLTDAAGDPLDRLTLEPVGPEGTIAPDLTTNPWWDLGWSTRQCHSLDHTDPDASTVDEFTHRVDIDLTELAADGLVQPDFGDIRAVDPAGVQLTMWTDAADDAVWVKLPSVPAGATTNFCLYYGAQTPGQTPLANHTEAAVFTAATPQPVYYAVHTRYGTGTSIDVASYVDGNQVSVDGGTPVTIDDGELVTITGILPNSIISSTGPITARARGNGYDSLVPISWAGTDFVVPSERERQRLSFYAPFADAEVMIYDGANATPLATVSVPVGTAVWVEPASDPVNNESIVVESDEPVLMVHDQSGATAASRDGMDTYPVAPFLDDEWFGVSSSTRLGANSTTTHVDQFQSNNANEIDRALTRGQRLNAGGGGSQGGGAQSGTYLRLDTDTVGDPESSPDAQFAAISQADSDGNESVTFFPRQELSDRYLVPTTAQYIAISCPDPNFDIEIRVPGQPVETVTCTGLNGSPVGHALRTATMAVTLPTATTPGQAVEVESVGGEPFYMYYENNASNDETNVMGNKQFRQAIYPLPVDTVTIEGLFPPSGTWLSPTFQTPLATGIFGTIDFDGLVVAGDTNIKVQVATGATLPPGTFLGPDGTAGSFYEIADLPSAIEFGHDGDEFIRVLVTLETTDPTDTPELISVDFDYDLPLLVRNLGVPNAIAAPTVAAPETQTAYLVRLTSSSLDPSASVVRLLDIGATGPVTTRNLRLENRALGIDSTQSVNGLNGNDVPQTFGSAAPLSVLGTFSLTAPTLPESGSVGILIHVDVDSTGIWAETDITADLTASP